MSEQSTLRKPLLLASAGLVTASLIYLAYSSYSTQQNRNNTGLHRRNAIRLPRRRWRRGFAPQTLTADPIAQAIEHLQSRIAARQPYGYYENQMLFGDHITQAALESGQFDLLPQNLGPLVRVLTSLRSFNELEAQILNWHVECIFVQTFLLEEIPAGYVIGDDAESLVHTMRSHGISEDVVRIMVARFDDGKTLTPLNWDLTADVNGISDTAQENPAENIADRQVDPQHALEALRGSLGEEASVHGWGDDTESDPGGSPGMLNLLYHIAGEQAKREGLVHRGVVCNSCGATPLRGVRYHCVNCFDFDLCESCEAQQVHHRTHVFYKIRIPTPSRGYIKQAIPVWYPGIPNAFPNTLPKSILKKLEEEVKVEKTELELLYEQYRCLAGHRLPQDSDPTGLGVAISRKNFDMYFTTTSDDRAPPQNLLYDRIFAFYDQNNDGLITFDEFVRGMTNLQLKTRAARVERVFKSYDLDADGYVDRRDFLRIFRAYYAWHKDFNRKIIANQDELDEDLRDAVHGTHPISAAFGWNNFASHMSRGGHDKQSDNNGDLQIVAGANGVLEKDSDVRGDRAHAIGNTAVRGQTRLYGNRTFRQEPETDEPVIESLFTYEYSLPVISHLDDVSSEEVLSSQIPEHVYGWPPLTHIEREDIINALGADVPIQEVTDPTDRARIIYAQSERIDAMEQDEMRTIRQNAVSQRWRRRQFYLDEQEGLTRPPGYTEPDSSDDEDAHAESIDEERDVEDPVPLQTSSSSRRQSMRSRSSSKVRFDDSAIDTDYETRSNTSSRSNTLNERWGGFEISEPEKDIGREILYQAIQQGFNELLDPLFKAKEDEGLEAIESERIREKWKAELDAYEAHLLNGAKPGGLSSPTHREMHKANHEKDKAEQAHDVSSSRKEPGRIGIPYENRLVPLIVDSGVEEIDTTLPHHRPNDSYVSDMFSKASASRRSKSRKEHVSAQSSASPSIDTLRKLIRHRAIEAEAQARGGYGKLSLSEFKRILAKEGMQADNEGSMNWERALATDPSAMRGERDDNRASFSTRRNRQATENDELIIGVDLNNGNTAAADSLGRAGMNTDTPSAAVMAQALHDIDEALASENGDATHCNSHAPLSDSIDDDDDDDDDDDSDDEDGELWAATADLGRYSFLGTWLEVAQF